jgi:hypothetical protein
MYMTGILTYSTVHMYNSCIQYSFPLFSIMYTEKERAGYFLDGVVFLTLKRTDQIFEVSI